MVFHGKLETGVFRFELTAGFDSQLGIFSGEDFSG